MIGFVGKCMHTGLSSLQRISIGLDLKELLLHFLNFDAKIVDWTGFCRVGFKRISLD